MHELSTTIRISQATRVRQAQYVGIHDGSSERKDLQVKFELSQSGLSKCGFMSLEFMTTIQ